MTFVIDRDPSYFKNARYNLSGQKDNKQRAENDQNV